MGTWLPEQRPVYRAGRTPAAGLPGPAGSTHGITMGSLCPAIQSPWGHPGPGAVDKASRVGVRDVQGGTSVSLARPDARVPAGQPPQCGQSRGPKAVHILILETGNVLPSMTGGDSGHQFPDPKVGRWPRSSGQAQGSRGHSGARGRKESQCQRDAAVEGRPRAKGCRRLQKLENRVPQSLQKEPAPPTPAGP